MVESFLILAPPILLAITFHEYAHGWTAMKFGDPTAKMMGRLTLNPLAHLDPIGTLMLFLVHFGWAKPVPVDPRYFSDPKRQMLWVALAGPVANMILAFFSGILIIGFASSNFMFSFKYGHYREDVSLQSSDQSCSGCVQYATNPAS